MNLTVSQWLQIAAIAISATISLSRWAWDAKKASRSIQAIQTASETKLIPAREKTSLGSKVAFFAPLLVLLWQTLRPGEITRFDFGIMIFSGMAFTGFLMIQVVNTVGLILEVSSAETNLMAKLAEGQSKNTDILARLVGLGLINTDSTSTNE